MIYLHQGTAPSSPMSQNYHCECGAAISQQINLELHVSYTYLAMAHHFACKDVALKNFADYFMQQSYMQRQHVETLLQLQNQNGGCIQFRDITKPEEDHWGSLLSAMGHHLHLQQSIHLSLQDLHWTAGELGVMQLCDFLESQCLNPQSREIEALGVHASNVHNLRGRENRLTEYRFDTCHWDDGNQEKCPGDKRVSESQVPSKHAASTVS
ncbi:ferritin heavy chain-like [Echinops telfairi]|uniref:Ferritin heavy chain-like n=1 Tax=Echinops telfairi TaxID=9371 RepID=A0AC55D0R2_ECHTE|nr:ferritin heavy chain-like [Echinops telfairi]